MRADANIANVNELALLINITHDFNDHLGIVGDIIKLVGSDPNNIEPFLSSLEACGASKDKVAKYRDLLRVMFRVGQPPQGAQTTLDMYRKQYGTWIH